MPDPGMPAATEFSSGRVVCVPWPHGNCPYGCDQAGLGIGVEVDLETPMRFAHDTCLPDSEFTTVMRRDYTRGFTNDRGVREYPLELVRQQNPPWSWDYQWGAPAPQNHIYG